MPTKEKTAYPCVSRWVPGRLARWSYVARALKAERSRTLGNYYVTTFEPMELSTADSKRQFRCSIKRFLAWRGRPVGMLTITNRLLDSFYSDEIKRGLPRLVALRYVAHVRRVVNHRWPGRLPMANESHPLPKTRIGTVERFVEDTFIPVNEKAGAPREKITRIRHIVRLLHDFHVRESRKRGKSGPFGRFDEQLCTKFLRSCVGKGVAVDTAGTTYRCELQSISVAAHAAGLMKRRLHIPVLSDRRRTAERQRQAKRRAKPSPNGQASSNGKKAGRRIAWPAAVKWLRSQDPEYLRSAKTADLRDQLRSAVKKPGELPPKPEFRALLSRARRGRLPRPVIA